MIDYLDKGKGGEVVVWLHGWAKGYSKEKYQELIDKLSEKYRVIALDFPGFGGSSLPPRPWGVDDYAESVAIFLKKMRVKEYVLAGHSFGGRVAIKMAVNKNNKIKKIILVDSAGIERKGMVVKLRLVLAKLVPEKLKAVIGGNLGAKDYRETTGVMRESMKLVVEENLEKYLPKIKTSTLLVWGKNDGLTPLWQGKLMNRLIEGSKLVIIPDANHRLPLDWVARLAKEMVEFIG
ncbi:MAG: alpha/beta hydrolase [Candidatus Shapirobacteria bacterium]